MIRSVSKCGAFYIEIIGEEKVLSQHNISTMAHLIAEPVRAVVLITLTDGHARSASALADVAGITAQTMSSHLGKLLDGGLVKVERKGRHRYYSLAGPHIPRALESLASIGPVSQAWRTTPNRSARELRVARCCYDHLAGQIGVAITQRMLECAYLCELGEYGYALTPTGLLWIDQLEPDVGFNVTQCARDAYRCLDWTERQYHVAGAFGAYLLNVFCRLGWMMRSRETRAVTVTQVGWDALSRHLSIQRNTMLTTQTEIDAPHFA